MPSSMAFCRAYRPSPLAAAPAESEAEKAAASARECGQIKLSDDRLRWALLIARIHDDPAAHSKADANDTEGVTIGRDVYFGRAASNMGSGERNALPAHELMHVAQQAEGRAPAGVAQAQKKDQTKLPAPDVQKKWGDFVITHLTVEGIRVMLGESESRKLDRSKILAVVEVIKKTNRWIADPDFQIKRCAITAPLALRLLREEAYPSARPRRCQRRRRKPRCGARRL